MNLYLQQRSFLERNAGFKISFLVACKLPKVPSLMVYSLSLLPSIANDLFHFLEATEGFSIAFISRLQRATLLGDPSSITISITDWILHSQIPHGHDRSSRLNLFNIDPIF